MLHMLKFYEMSYVVPSLELSDFQQERQCRVVPAF